MVPAAYLRLRNRINRMGIGVGSLITGDGSWDWYLKHMTEDDAIHFCEMPIFTWFTAFDYAELSGRDPQECAEICEDMAARGFLGKGVRVYQQASTSADSIKLAKEVTVNICAVNGDWALVQTTNKAGIYGYVRVDRLSDIHLK